MRSAPESNHHQPAEKRAYLRRLRWWHGLLGVGIVLIFLFGVFVRKSRLEELKSALIGRGEKLTVAELAPSRPVGRDAVLQHLDRAYSTFHKLTIQRRQSAGGSEKLPRWQQSTFHGYDGSVMEWNMAATEMEMAKQAFATLKVELRNLTSDPPWDYAAMTSSGGTIQAGNSAVALAIRKRTTAQWLGNRALVALQKGDRESALESIVTFLGLIRWHAEDRLYMNQMIRAAMAGLAADVTWEALQADGWTEPELAQLQHAWSQVRLLSPFRKALEMERAFGLVHFESVRTGSRLVSGLGTGIVPAFLGTTDQLILAPFYRTFWASADERFYLEVTQTIIEAARRLEQDRTMAGVAMSVSELTQTVSDSQKGLGKYRNFVAGQLIPNMEVGFRTVVRAHTLQQLTVSAVAIKRWTLAHGTVPAGLEALQPDFLAEIPVDPANGAPFRYLKEGEGRFVLYGCGGDGRDDGGDGGKDIVWNRPPWAR